MQCFGKIPATGRVYSTMKKSPGETLKIRIDNDGRCRAQHMQCTDIRVYT